MTKLFIYRSLGMLIVPKEFSSNISAHPIISEWISTGRAVVEQCRSECRCWNPDAREG